LQRLIQAGLLHALKGRAGWPSLFFVLGAVLCLLAAALLQGNAYRWAALALLALAFGAAPAKAWPANRLGLAVAAWCAWLFAITALATPSYSADAMVRPLILLAGFAVAASLGRESLQALFRCGTLLLAALALIGLLQFFFGFLRLSINPQRAAATFITPNSFATAINLLLLPLLALAVSGHGGKLVLPAALWLYAGLLATESRGGWVALAAGGGFIAAYLGTRGTRAAWKPFLQSLAALAAVTVAFAAASSKATGAGAGAGAAFGETLWSRGTSLRSDIYEVALGLIAERPIAGHGADMFRFLYEMRKPATMDNGHPFLFVHNDYLQLWLEFGLVGLLLLGAVLLAALASLLRARRVDPHDPLPLACGAALAGILVHALVDFPLYLPFLLLVFGLWLGALAAHTSGGGLSQPVLRAARSLRPVFTPLVCGVLGAAALAWFSQPMLADAASDRALARLQSGDAGGALYWASVARRLEPRNGAHYWIEGVIWRDQAAESRDKGMLAKADMLFADGMRADPYQVANYLERARTRRKHADLFGTRSEQEVLDWTAQALKLRPYAPLAQAERARALDYAGRTEEARRIARAMLERHPASDMARGLSREFPLPAAAGKAP
jgi:O-antigen ligase